MGQITGDWTYEKAWQEPEEIIISYEKLIDKHQPGLGVEQASATFTDHQWAETYTQYQTFTYVTPDGDNEIQDLVVQRIRVNHKTAASVAANFYKWILEHQSEDMHGGYSRPTNKDVVAREITEYEYEVTVEGWAAKTETTRTEISGWEYLGSIPCKDFRPFARYHPDKMEQTYQASETKKYFYSTDTTDGKFNTRKMTRKRIYTKTTTMMRTMYALTQEGQQYIDGLLSKENGEGSELSGAEMYWRTLESWREGNRLVSDGVQVNSSLGRMQMEERPDEYEQAEEDLNDDEDSNSDDEADSADEDTAEEEEDETAPARVDLGGGYDFGNGDLEDRWAAWTPYDEVAGSQSPKNQSNKWQGDPLKSGDTRPQFEVQIRTGSSRPDRGYIYLNKSNPREVSEISIARTSMDGYWTNDLRAGQRILINSYQGGCVYWYLIRSVHNDGATARVAFIDDILDTGYQEMVCSRIENSWIIKAIVTSTSDRGDRVFEMPYSPDDFLICKGGDFHVVPGNAQAAAGEYVKVQKRLLDGQTKGINVTTSLKEMPSAPFSDVYLNMLGTSVYGRTNGTSWAFNDSGCIVSTDVIYGGHAGQDGSAQGLKVRRKILAQAEGCPVQQSEGWVEPPDGLSLDDLPLIVPDFAPTDDVRKADSVDMPVDFDIDHPPCSFWTDDLPQGQNDEVAAETVTTEHVYLSQDIPVLVGRTRTRAKVQQFDGVLAFEPEPLNFFVHHRGDAVVISADDPIPELITRNSTYALVTGWHPGDQPDNPEPPPPNPDGPDLDCKLKVTVGFGIVPGGLP